MLNQALQYAARGFHIFPVHGIRNGHCTCKDGADCQRPGKHPACEHGMLAATTDETQIRKWWTARPYLNIGCYCKASGLFVLDVDGPEGIANLQVLVDSLGLDLAGVPRSRTGGGGYHYFFLAPDEAIRNDSNWLPGIDTRTDGYVILPPSMHASGGVYTWEVEP